MHRPCSLSLPASANDTAFDFGQFDETQDELATTPETDLDEQVLCFLFVLVFDLFFSFFPFNTSTLFCFPMSQFRIIVQKGFCFSICSPCVICLISFHWCHHLSTLFSLSGLCFFFFSKSRLDRLLCHFEPFPGSISCVIFSSVSSISVHL